MKFTINIDMTPEELRRALGLPDVAALQDEMISRIREQMDAGAEGYDPLTLLKPYLSQSVGSMEAFQKMLFTMMSQYGRNDDRKG
ncbi:hypothetical protein ADIMK_1944 [Marinobacterium lacunae]|uniref:Uncharacterized protein n=1 Tax=Marinobacterium lacunae TaxID=1232683 RepID=A0A081FZ62_9GAMM|nr:DUF6489 family protein [Marinobacterium lacunae]KEA63817.1 hypothetical protein ADIMK_1944 [Marinobacterium lacunae]MBR9882525.1 hypothetical protein [Oceanospirillales bacterium]